MAKLLSPGRYGLTLLFMICLIILDISINSISNFYKWSNINLLILYIVQDVGIMLSFITLLCTFFSTYMFKVGLIKLLFERFACTIAVCILYFLISIYLHTWILMIRWEKPEQTDFWKNHLIILFGIQRFVSPFHYYFYKRSALRISDPRFYEDEYWIKEQLNKCPCK